MVQEVHLLVLMAIKDMDLMVLRIVSMEIPYMVQMVLLTVTMVILGMETNYLCHL